MAELDLHKAIHQLEVKLEVQDPGQAAQWRRQQQRQRRELRQLQRRGDGWIPVDNEGMGSQLR